MEYNQSHKVGAAIARFRGQAELTQAYLASQVCIDQSRLSRIEKGEVFDIDDINRILSKLTEEGVSEAKEYREFISREWTHIAPPSFWNPQRRSLESAHEALEKIDQFLKSEERPWPLRRQVEKQKEALLRAADFLGKQEHSVAFFGDIGVGKSTAISCIFDLLTPNSQGASIVDRPVLETGAGGTTVCEVHIKSGPEFGISIIPESDSEVRAIVAEFCAAKWMAILNVGSTGEESITVSREIDRAIRNMSGLTRKRVIADGKPIRTDPIVALVKSCSNEDEFRTRVLGLMRLDLRTRHELWYDSSTRKHPMEWVAETFKAVNNGRLSDVSLPKRIHLLIPGFSDKSFGELEVAIIDTKGVDDVTVREDLDLRLRDPRSAAVFCSRFNDAPGTSSRALLQHMSQTFSERFDAGKVSILALPRSDEARSMKDDEGEQALTDDEGYDFKKMQVTSVLEAENLGGIPVGFFNVERENPSVIKDLLLVQLNSMRGAVDSQLLDLCGAVDDIIGNHEAQALNAAIAEVARRLSMFLKGNNRLGARECLAHVEATQTIQGVRYASTLWASTRRNGEHDKLNIPHLLGIGAARDANLRSRSWFTGLEAFLNELKADDDLSLAISSIDQISSSASVSRRDFIDASQRGGLEVYREPLTQAAIVWAQCAAEWGCGSGFKNRVVGHLDKWFSEKVELKERLELMTNNLWEQIVIAPLLRLAEETAPESSSNPKR